MNKEPLLPTEAASFQLEADKCGMPKQEQKKQEAEEEGRITEQAVLLQTPNVTAIQEKPSDPKQFKCL
jgi:ribosomal protein L24